MGGILSVSDEYHKIGKTSIKSIANPQNQCSVDAVYVISSQDIGKSFTTTFDAYSTNNCETILYYRITNEAGSATITNTITVPANNNTPITLTLSEIPSNVYSVCFRLTSVNAAPIYVDNIIMNVQ